MQEKLLSPPFFLCCKKHLVPPRIEPGSLRQEAGIVTSKPWRYLRDTHDINSIYDRPMKFCCAEDFPAGIAQILYDGPINFHYIKKN